MSHEIDYLALIQKLAVGWDASITAAPSDLARRWIHGLSGEAEIKQVTANLVYFVADLSHVHLSRMDEVRCLLVGGSPATAEGLVREVLRSHGAPGRRFVVQALSSASCNALRGLQIAYSPLVLGPEFLQKLLVPSDGCHLLTMALREQFSLSSLNPYSITLSATGSMFFGRERELRRLLDDGDSLAVVGPMRIGKTSLLKQYVRTGCSKRNPWALHSSFVDCYESAQKTSDSVARTIAMSLDPSSRANRTTSSDLVPFLRHCSHRLGHPVNLLLDEVDEVCGLEVFDLLTEAAKNGHIRMILCGRGALFRRTSAGLIKGRLEVVRLEPLDIAPARKLIFEPLEALGFAFEDRSALEKRLLHLSGRLPHVLQYYGRKLVEVAIEAKTSLLTSNHLELLRSDLATAEYVTSAVRDLRDADLRFVALALLKKDPGSVTPSDVHRIAEDGGLTLNYQRCLDICNDLVINGILIWEGSSYRIAMGALPDYARDLGYLSKGLDEARATLDRKGTASGGGMG
jgi:AAA domain